MQKKKAKNHFAEQKKKKTEELKTKIRKTGKLILWIDRKTTNFLRLRLSLI